MDSLKKVRILRNASIITHPFTNYFIGFETVKAIQQIFGEKTDAVLRDLRVEITSGRGYMNVSDEDGHLRVNVNYLNNGDERDIYLDIIHELVHVKQFMDGKKLHDRNFQYADSPTEIEAYGHAVEEARNLGMSDEQIFEYLHGAPALRTDEDINRLATNLNVKIKKPS